MAEDPFAGLNLSSTPPPPASAPSGGAAPSSDPFAGLNLSSTPPPPATSTAADIYKGGTSGVVQGVGGLPAAPTSIGDYLARIPGKLAGMTDEDFARINAENAAAQSKTAAGRIHQAIDPGKVAGAASQALTSGLDVGSAAVGGGTSTYQPTTGYGEAAQIGGSFLPGAVTGELGVAPVAGRLLTRAAIPATGAFVGGKVAEDVGLDKQTGQIIGGIAGGMVPHVSPVSTIGEALVPRVAPELAEAAERQGWQAPVGLATQSPILQFLGKTGQSIPFAGAPLEAAYRKFFNQMGESASAATAEGGAMSTADAGALAIKGLQDWNQGMSPKVSSAFTGTRNMIDQQASTLPLDATRGIAQDIATKYQGMRQPLPPSVQKVLDAVTDPNGLSFNEITDLRTLIGGLKGNWGQITAQGMNPAELERLYGGLTQDAENSAMAGGGQPAVAAWRKARDLQQDTAGRRQAIGGLLGLQGQATPEAVMAGIQRMAGSGAGADINTLQQIKDMIGPKAWEPIASTIAQGMGFDPTTNQFSALRLLSAYRKNLSNDGRDALFGPAGTPGLRQTYDDLGTWAERAKILDRYGNPSGTAQTTAGGNFLSDMVFDPIRTIKGVVGSGGLSVLLARPATASSLSRFTRAYQAQSFAQRAGAASTTGMRNLYGSAVNLANTAKAAGFTLRPDQLIGGLTGAPAALPPGDQGSQ